MHNRIASFHEELTKWRRHLHENPETGFEEFKTSEFVAEKLTSFGIEVHRGLAKTGVVGVLKGDRPGRMIGLRADMDALDMVEENDFAHASKIPGKMHGCGHDGHTTMLLGAAKYLAETKNFAGTVCFIFQPAEEGLAGGKVMIEDGLFEKFPCDEVYGMHNWPGLSKGKIALNSGAIMASADEFKITITGKGAHAAMPHLGVDTVLVGSQIVSSLQSLVSRNTSPLDSAVVSVPIFNAGTAYNVLPEHVKLGGTARSLNEETRDRLEEGIKKIAHNTAETFGATAEVIYERSYPVTVNHPAQSAYAGEVAISLVGTENVDLNVEPSMGAEDFSYMLQKRPGCYIFLGAGGGPSCFSVHHPKYDFNDEIIPLGVSYWVKLVEGRK